MVEEQRRRLARQTGFTGIVAGEKRQATLFEAGQPEIAERGFAPIARAPPAPVRPPPAPPKIGVGHELVNPSEAWKWNNAYTLRGYQREAVDAFLARSKGSVILPTGTGKTLIAARLIFILRVPTVVIVPTLVLVDQWRRELKKYANIDAGAYYGEEKRPAFVTISTYQTLYSNPEVIRRFPFIIEDEGDVASAGEIGRGTGFYSIMDEAALPEHMYALVITATLPSDTQRRAYMSRIVPVIYSMSVQAGQEIGALAPLTILPIGIDLTQEEQQTYEEIQEKLQKLSRTLGTSNPRDWSRMTRSGDESIRRSAYAALREFSRRRQLLAFAENKDVVVYNIARMNQQQRVLVFSEAVDALVRLKTYLGQHGVAMENIVGGTPTAERTRIIGQWGTGFWVLGSVKVLERGFNVPEAGIAILLASGRGETQITQRIGRILRPQPGKEAKLYVVYARGTIESALPARVREVIRGEHIPVVESEEQERDFF